MTMPDASPLTAGRLGPDPIVAVRDWLRTAEERAGVRDPNAACLSTIGEDGWPQARIVLVKGIDERGLAFFTNYESAKGRALAHTPKAALTFFWDALGRQVRITGAVTRAPEDDSDRYFHSRPVGSRIGAWASDQSRPIESRAQLEARAEAVRARFRDGEVPRPPHWGGFLLEPRSIEFWQEGAYRLHDRILFEREGDGPWRISRLSP